MVENVCTGEIVGCHTVLGSINVCARTAINGESLCLGIHVNLYFYLNVVVVNSCSVLCFVGVSDMGRN